MSSWAILERREQNSRDRESKKLTALIDKRSEQRVLREKTQTLLSQYEEQLQIVQAGSFSLNESHLYRSSIGQMRNALEQLDMVLYRLERDIQHYRSLVRNIEHERRKFQLLVDNENEALADELIRHESRILDDFSIVRFKTKNKLA